MLRFGSRETTSTLPKYLPTRSSTAVRVSGVFIMVCIRTLPLRAILYQLPNSLRLDFAERGIPGDNRHMKRSGVADLPLHGGRVPAWLAERMTRLGTGICESVLYHYGTPELLSR